MPAQQRTALLSVVAAAGLVAIKLVTGLLTGSLGLLAEALHSGTDLVAALLTFYAVRVSGRPPDRDHPFGHGKAEHLTALGEGAFLVVVSGVIVAISIGRLAGGSADAGVDAAWYAIAVLVVVMAIDAARATISWRTAQRYSSPALASNAVHFGSDLLGTGAVLAGLLLVRAGYPDADAIAALIVAVLVVGAAARLMRRNVEVLMDRSPAAAEADARHAIAAAEPGVDLRRLRVRQAAGRHFVDAVVGITPDSTAGQGHALADAVEDAVRTALPDSDVVVHVEPNRPAADLRERASGAALAVRGVREVHNVSTMLVAGSMELSLHLKLPPQVTLEAAHDVADEVEQAILAAAPEIHDVHIHLEPLAGASAAAEQPRGGEVTHVRRAIRRVARDLTGTDPRAIRIRRGPDGLLALVTVTLPGDRPLGAAHETAAQIERRVREEAPDLHEVVVHTEPA